MGFLILNVTSHYSTFFVLTGPWLNSSSLSDPQAAGDDSSDVTRRLRQRHEEERKMSEESSRRLRVDELLYHQDMLKREMMDAKNRLMVPAGHWNYECKLDCFIKMFNVYDKPFVTLPIPHSIHRIAVIENSTKTKKH